MSAIRVLLVDDQTILRVGLRAFLHYHDDIQVIGEAQDGKEAMARVDELRPDVVLMDIAMPGMNGIDATKQICERYPDARVLILSQYNDAQYVLPLLRAGATGYILKDALGTDLLTALRTVASGETFLCPSVAKTLAQEIRDGGAVNANMQEPLTPREREVLKHITLGQTSARIAEALSISVNTVEWHRGNIMNKLDVHTVVDLVRYALRHGLADSDV